MAAGDCRRYKCCAGFMVMAIIFSSLAALASSRSHHHMAHGAHTLSGEGALPLADSTVPALMSYCEAHRCTQLDCCVCVWIRGGYRL